MSDLSPYANQACLGIETYRKNGQPMPTPVWFVQAGEILYVRSLPDKMTER